MTSIRSIKSWLFTPATRPDRFGKAAAAGAGASIIDLEDSVAPPEKAAARATALRYLESLPSAPPLALRLNALGTKFGLEDVQSFLNSSAQPDYVFLPKCESAAEIALLANWFREAGKSAQILVQIETAKGIAALDQIVRAIPPPAALVFGAADMAADLGAETAWEPLLWARSRLAMAAAVAGIHLVDSPYFHIADTDGLRRETEAAAALGFHAKCAIHPSQISVINAVLTPSEEEIDKARRIVALEAQGAGIADRQMVDKAVVRVARLVLERAGV
jgi:(S)-citramalyl-CoA lyase